MRRSEERHGGPFCNFGQHQESRPNILNLSRALDSYSWPIRFVTSDGLSVFFRMVKKLGAILGAHLRASVSCGQVVTSSSSASSPSSSTQEEKDWC